MNELLSLGDNFASPVVAAAGADPVKKFGLMAVRALAHAQRAGLEVRSPGALLGPRHFPFRKRGHVLGLPFAP